MRLKLITSCYRTSTSICWKFRKLLDCEEVRHKMRAVVIDEARLIVEWQVFNICIDLFPFIKV